MVADLTEEAFVINNTQVTGRAEILAANSDRALFTLHRLGASLLHPA